MKTLRRSSIPVHENYDLSGMNAKYKHFMCRLCLCKSGTLSDIHGCKVGSGLIAAAVISDLLQLEVSTTDGYPQLVCLECLKKLFDFRSFKDSCWKAKFNFETFYSSAASSGVHGIEGMSDDRISSVINHGDFMEISEEYSNPYAENYVRKTKFIPEMYAKEEPVDESEMKDPLSLDSSDSNMEELSEEDITIKEEEFQINERLSVPVSAPVTLIERKGSITVTQVNSDIEIEDSKGPLDIIMPNSLSTIELSRDASPTNSTDHNSNQANTKQFEENNVIKETIGHKEINNTSSSSMLLLPVKFSVKLNVQGQNQGNKYTGEAAQNEGTTDNQMEIREEGKNSAFNGKETGENIGKNLIKDGPYVGKNKARIPSVQYFCQKCCKMLSSMCDLISHNCATEVPHTLQSKKIFDCKVCGKRFETEKKLWNHSQKHNLNNNVLCKICGKGFLKEYLSIHLATHKTDSSLQPDIASSSVFSMPSVESVGDSGQIQKYCNQGEVVSNSNVAIISKKDRIENKLWKFENGNTCPICGGMFSSLYTLKRHVIQQHSEKNFKCSLCPKKFRTEKGVECHSKKHGENMPYHCEFCRKGFLREDFFTKHVSNHARNDPFQCDRCGKNFNHKKPLWTHIAWCYKTKRFKCNVCNNKYYSEAYLSIHKTIHTG